jgi:hypothetical protein
MFTKKFVYFHEIHLGTIRVSRGQSGDPLPKSQMDFVSVIIAFRTHVPIHHLSNDQVLTPLAPNTRCTSSSHRMMNIDRVLMWIWSQRRRHVFSNVIPRAVVRLAPLPWLLRPSRANRQVVEGIIGGLLSCAFETHSESEFEREGLDEGFHVWDGGGEERPEEHALLLE